MSETAEKFDPGAFAPTQSSQKAFLKQYVPQDDDEGVIAYFFKYREFQPFESQKQGREVYRDVDFVNIRVIGNDKMTFEGPARDADKRRFPFAWQQYQAGAEQSKKGTPLEDLGISPSQIVQFHAKNIYTAEDLAHVSDGNLQMLPPGTRELRHKAREITSARAKQSELSAEVQELKKMNAQLAEQLQRALGKLEEKSKAPKGGKRAATTEA